MSERKASEIAESHFAQRFNCAEAVLMGVAEAAGLSCDCVPKIATGFGAGFGGYGEICGALSGAIMALGLKYGRESAEDLESKAVTFGKVKELLAAFEAEYGSVRCIDLTECDMKTPAGTQRAKEMKLHTDFCPRFVRFAAEQAEKLMAP